ncbi:MAG TPA: sugar phosphate nucleotidyltransferase, partial [Longimicrobiales bacterium]|nr:sugar phosphate nucleotidyltransferase [Longimicrobiales bacterium]
PLASAEPLVSDTIRRIEPLVPLDRVRILTGRELVAPIRGAVQGIEDRHFLVEPRARGTAPVLAWAAHELARQDPDAVMVSLHADHVIRPEADFLALVAAAAEATGGHDRLYTLGMRPTRPETGYGYIRRGAPLGDSGAYEVDAFVEKPDAATAIGYVDSGEYLWNSGIFIWRAATLLDEVRAHTPEIADLLPLLDRGDTAAFFQRAPSLSIDEGVLERSGRVGVFEARFQWDDVGTWDAVARTQAGRDGNVVRGDATVVESSGSVIWNETDEPVVVFGATDLVVVRVRGVTLVLPRDRAADLKDLLAQLPSDVLERVQ